MIRKIIIYTILLNIVSNNIYAQFTNTNWCLGDSSGISWGITTNFFQSASDGLRGVCSSISDQNNQLLLYASATRYGLYLQGLIHLPVVLPNLHTQVP